MSEFALMKEVLAAFGRGATRLFRCNAGVSWQGLEVSRNSEYLTLRNPRPVHGWPAGSSDLVGWQSVVITPAMVGQTVAVFVAVETKSPSGKVKAEQRRFLNAVRRAGGLAVAARSVSEAAAVLGPPGGGVGSLPVGHGPPRPAMPADGAVAAAPAGRSGNGARGRQRPLL